jgi:hypothetical protein
MSFARISGNGPPSVIRVHRKLGRIDIVKEGTVEVVACAIDVKLISKLYEFGYRDTGNKYMSDQERTHGP